MSGKYFQISVAMIDWIAKQQGLSSDELAHRIAPKTQERFLNGEINKSQADKLTKLAHIPFGFLFLQNPPATKPTLPDFRNTMDSVPLSHNFFDLYDDIQGKLEWYQDYLMRHDMYEPIDFVGKYNTNTPLDTIVQDIRQSLVLDNINLNKIKKDEYLKQITSRIENMGVLVFTNGVVGADNHRVLDIAEFRGFAIADKYTPAIFINGNDSKSAQLFTLIHELTHIYTGQTGISDWSYPFVNHIERYCNKVASLVLMPTDVFMEKWQNSNIDMLSDYFKTSKISVAIKAHELNLIDDTMVCHIRDELNDFLRAQKEQKKGGGNYYTNVPIRNSRKLTQMIVNDTINQHTPLAEAGRLLRVKPKALFAGVF